MKQTKIVSSQELVKKFFSNLEKTSNFKENSNNNKTLSIFDAWERIIGNKNLSDHCELLNIENQTAIITVNHQGWSQQILLNKKNILYNFNKFYPELNIKNLSIVVTNNIKLPQSTSKKNTSVERHIKLDSSEYEEYKEIKKYPELDSALNALKKSIQRKK